LATNAPDNGRDVCKGAVENSFNLWVRQWWIKAQSMFDSGVNFSSQKYISTVDFKTLSCAVQQTRQRSGPSP
jgi:hypothetical protein